MGQKEKVRLRDIMKLKDIPLLIFCYIYFSLGDLLRKVKCLWRG